MDYRLDYEKYDICARRIQSCWRNFQNQKLFHCLINTLHSAEQCVTPAVLGQISPLEASLLKDQSLQCKVRFRLSGCQFPPVIVFKIFHTARGGRYLSGTKLFKPANQATTDSCRMMGNRKFLDLLMEEEVWWRGRKITEPTDITCMRDYIQYSSHLDALPACVGGRENTWRCLNLQVLPRELRKEERLEPAPQPARTLRSPTAPPSSAVSSRRSAQAKNMAARRKHLYSRRDNQEETGDNEDDDDDEEWEEEVDKLCCWTDQLTLDTIDQLDQI